MTLTARRISFTGICWINYNDYMRRKVFSINTELDKVTGVQKVLLDVHRAVKDDYEAKIVGTIPYEKVNGNHGISRAEYLQLKNPFMFRNSIVFVHERKLLALFWLLNHLMFQKIKVIYVHHNVLYGWKHMPIMPKIIVAISDSGIENLTGYFKVPIGHIHKIYNCVMDIKPRAHSVPSNGDISIIYPARINDVKRQIEIVNRLEGKIDSRVKIYFAGEGPMLEQLKERVKGNDQFIALGFRADVLSLMQEMDYMMLFSKHEGLPITLIEADMTGTPVICNKVGGNAEIVHNGENGFVLEKDDWEGLIKILNALPEISAEEFKRLSDGGRSLYEKNFTFDRFKESYLSLVREILTN